MKAISVAQAIVFLAFLDLAAAAPLAAQCPAGAPPGSGEAFAAFSVRQSSQAAYAPIAMDPAHLRISGSPVRRIIMAAYGLRPDQVVGGPAWLDTQYYQITAATARPSTRAQEMRMLQRALVDSFHLACHESMSPERIFVLTAPHGAAKLKALAAGATPSPPGVGEFTFTTVSGLVEILNSFAQNGMLAHPVLDRSGLTGRYDIHLHMGGGAVGQISFGRDQAARIPLMLERQFGLKLTARTEPVLHLIIDSITRPTPN